MQYEVTATRRRPQSFENLVGQEFVVQTFKNSIQSGKIAHAYLFSGPRGCGKTSTARILAKALNCVHGPTATPCGECEICKEITAGSSLDVIEIDGASNTSVDDVRQIKDEVLFPPNSSRYKIYIIDEVHMLTKNAFNALLKTIEEPPPYAIFIFATTELQKVPATIKSRCQQFNFRLVPVEKVKEQLSQACAEMGLEAEDEALYWIAREAGGSMRDSYTLFDQIAAFSDKKITYEKIKDKLGLVGVDSLNILFELCVDSKSQDALLLIDDYLQSGVSIDTLISNCSDYLRSLLLIRNGVLKESLLGQNPERFSKKVLDAWNNIKIERALSIFLQLYRDIRYSLNPRFELELAFSRLCWLGEYVSSTDVKKAIDSVKPVMSQLSFARKIEVTDSGSSSSETGSSHEAVTISNSGSSENLSSQPAPAIENKLPAGMPTFSALQNEGGGQANPFSNGGAEPPYINSADQWSQTYSIDESINESMDESQEENYFDEVSDLNVESESGEESGESGKNQIDEQKIQNFAALQDYDSEEVQESSIIKQVSLDSLDKNNFESVKQYLVSVFTNQEEALTASCVMSLKNWHMEGAVLNAEVENQFELQTSLNHVAKISAELSKIYGETKTLKIEVKQQSVNKKEELPDQVKKIRDMFRGSVIGWK